MKLIKLFGKTLTVAFAALSLTFVGCDKGGDDGGDGGDGGDAKTEEKGDDGKKDDAK